MIIQIGEITNKRRFMIKRESLTKKLDLIHIRNNQKQNKDSVKNNKDKGK
jgi:hypothetical protein